MLPIHYSERRQSRHKIHTPTMSPMQNDSTAYSQQKEDLDRRIHFGDLKRESIKTEDKDS